MPDNQLAGVDTEARMIKVAPDRNSAKFHVAGNCARAKLLPCAGLAPVAQKKALVFDGGYEQLTIDPNDPHLLDGKRRSGTKLSWTRLTD